MWLCRCDCGKEKVLQGKLIKSGNTKSCGCLRDELRSRERPHNSPKRRPAEYLSWCHIKTRCLNPKCPSYPDYGGRGITVCERWKNSFQDFFEDMGPRPSASHSIERNNNNGNYEPSNCRWASPKDQANNRRNSRIIEFQGKSQTAQQWSDELKIPHHIIHRKHALGWPINQICEYAAMRSAHNAAHPKNRKYEFNGKSMTLQQWSISLGLSKNAVRHRIALGWTITDALSMGRTRNA